MSSLNSLNDSNKSDDYPTIASTLPKLSDLVNPTSQELVKTSTKPPTYYNFPTSSLSPHRITYSPHDIIYTDTDYALWPRDSIDFKDEARAKYISTLKTKHEVISFIESELDKEEPLTLPQPYTKEQYIQLKNEFDTNAKILAQCQTKFCPDISDHYNKILDLALNLDNPEHIYTYRKCRFDRILNLDNPNQCKEGLLSAQEKVIPRINTAIENEYTLLTGDHLEHYNGKSYQGPFWFEGAGDIWRRWQHHSTLLDKNTPCQDITKEMQQCLINPQKTDNECYLPFVNHSICMAGVNCRHLRVGLMNCAKSNSFTNYQGLQQCVESLPQYDACVNNNITLRDENNQITSLSPPSTIQVDVTDLIDPHDLGDFSKNVKQHLLQLRKEKYEEMIKLYAKRAVELIDIKNPEYTDSELAYLLKHKHIPFNEATAHMEKIDIKHALLNPYDNIIFSESFQLQPSLDNPRLEREQLIKEFQRFRQFHQDVLDSRDTMTKRIDDHLALLARIREQTRLRQRHSQYYPDVKQVVYYDNFWNMYFEYQPILNASYPIFPLNHLYHYQDFDYDWVDSAGLLSSVPYIRLDRLGQHYSPTHVTRNLLQAYPSYRLLACYNDPECDQKHRSTGAYLGYPQLDNMQYLNHYRMYFPKRDMYMTCYANDTQCIPSRFPDDNYCTFKDHYTQRNWFYRPDTFQYYSYLPESNDRLVYNISDQTTIIYTLEGIVQPTTQQQHRDVLRSMKKQAEIWEDETGEILLQRQKKENILHNYLNSNTQNSTTPRTTLTKDYANTQYDARIPYTVHPFANFFDNLDAYKYYKGLKQYEQIQADDILAADPSRQVRDRLRYKYRRFLQFYTPITSLPDDDANRMRDALLLSFHELKLSRHPFGSIILSEMPPRLSDRFSEFAYVTQRQESKYYTMFDYLQDLHKNKNSAVLFDTQQDSPGVLLYMKRHNIVSFDDYIAIVTYAQDFQHELIEEYQRLEFNELTQYQHFLRDKTVSAASLKLTYTEKLTRLFQLYEKYGKVAPQLGIFCAPFGWQPNDMRHATKNMYDKLRDQLAAHNNIEDILDLSSVSTPNMATVPLPRAGQSMASMYNEFEVKSDINAV